MFEMVILIIDKCQLFGCSLHILRISANSNIVCVKNLWELEKKTIFNALG